MYNKNDKRRLYWLIDNYLNKIIDETVFCDEFYYCYNLELNHSTLSEREKNVFTDLDRVVSRFSPYKEDFKLFAGIYFTIEQLNKKIVETKEKLKED